jgi:hypothetical protein
VRLRKVVIPEDVVIEPLPQNGEEPQKPQYHPEGEKPFVEAAALTSEEVHGGEERSDSGEGVSPSQSGRGEVDSESASSKQDLGLKESCGGRESGGNTPAEGGLGEPEECKESGGKGGGEALGGGAGRGEKNGGQCSGGEDASPRSGEKDVCGGEGGGLSGEDDGDVWGRDGSGDDDCGGEGVVWGGGRRNYEKVVYLRRVRDRRLKTAFQRWLERIAELETKIEVPGDPERLSMRRVMRRILDRRPLSNCYVQRLKDTVVLLLDTSGSMVWWTEILRVMATIAVKLKDVEIFEAPNGLVKRPIKALDVDGCGWMGCGEFHARFMRRIRGRIIIYIGDFDGGDTPYLLAQNNRVYWLCNERRYRDTIDHDWCHFSLSELPKRCSAYRVLGEEDLVRVFTGKCVEMSASDSLS